MLSFLETFLIPLFAAALKAALKDPKAFTKVKSVLQEIATDLTALLAEL